MYRARHQDVVCSLFEGTAFAMRRRSETLFLYGRTNEIAQHSLQAIELNPSYLINPIIIQALIQAIAGSVVEWLKHRTDDQHGLGSKPTCAILLCP